MIGTRIARMDRVQCELSEQKGSARAATLLAEADACKKNGDNEKEKALRLAASASEQQASLCKRAIELMDTAEMDEAQTAYDGGVAASGMSDCFTRAIAAEEEGELAEAELWRFSASNLKLSINAIAARLQRRLDAEVAWDFAAEITLQKKEFRLKIIEVAMADPDCLTRLSEFCFKDYLKNASRARAEGNETAELWEKAGRETGAAKASAYLKILGHNARARGRNDAASWRRLKTFAFTASDKVAQFEGNAKAVLSQAHKEAEWCEEAAGNSTAYMHTPVFEKTRKAFLWGIKEAHRWGALGRLEPVGFAMAAKFDSIANRIRKEAVEERALWSDLVAIKQDIQRLANAEKARERGTWEAAQWMIIADREAVGSAKKAEYEANAKMASIRAENDATMWIKLATNPETGDITEFRSNAAGIRARGDDISRLWEDIATASPLCPFVHEYRYNAENIQAKANEEAELWTGDIAAAGIMGESKTLSVDCSSKAGQARATGEMEAELWEQAAFHSLLRTEFYLNSLEARAKKLYDDEEDFSGASTACESARKHYAAAAESIHKKDVSDLRIVLAKECKRLAEAHINIVESRAVDIERTLSFKHIVGWSKQTCEMLEKAIIHFETGCGDNWSLEARSSQVETDSCIQAIEIKFPGHPLKLEVCSLNYGWTSKLLFKAFDSHRENDGAKSLAWYDAANEIWFQTENFIKAIYNVATSLDVNKLIIAGSGADFLFKSLVDSSQERSNIRRLVNLIDKAKIDLQAAELTYDKLSIMQCINPFEIFKRATEATKTLKCATGDVIRLSQELVEAKRHARDHIFA